MQEKLLDAEDVAEWYLASMVFCSYGMFSFMAIENVMDPERRLTCLAFVSGIDASI